MPSLSRLSGQIVRDNNDAVADGALAYFYVGGTTTPLTVYQNAGQTTPHTHPVVADGDGRWPAIFIPFTTSYDEKVTTSTGTQLTYYLLIPNPDPVEVAAGAVTTSSEQILQTGDFLFQAKSGTRSGFVRANGRTMGNAASGGTERANDDTSALFVYLWNNFADALAAVSGGRGASAAADFAANKTITLFDLRGSTLVGLDDMGGAAASRLGSATFTTGNSTTGGSICGENTHVLTAAELAAHTHTVGTLSIGAEAAHTHGVGSIVAGAEAAHVHAVLGTTDFVATGITVTGATSANFQVGGATTAVTGGGAAAGLTVTDPTHQHSINFTSGAGSSHTHTISGTSAAGSSHTHTIGGSVASNGLDTAHNNVSRAILGNWLIKL